MSQLKTSLKIHLKMMNLRKSLHLIRKLVGKENRNRQNTKMFSKRMLNYSLKNSEAS